MNTIKRSKFDTNGKNGELADDLATEWRLRAKSAALDIFTAFDIEQPEERVVTNPFAIEKTSYSITNLTLDTQLTKFEKESYAIWSECNGDGYEGQTGDKFVNTTTMMTKLWSFHKTKSAYPTLCEIYEKVILDFMS